MLELFVKIFLSPEDILGMMIDMLTIISMCLVFSELKEKWWKSLIPIYSTYFTYKLVWKHKWFCLLEYSFILLQSKSLSVIRKEIVGNIFDVLIALFKQEELFFDINIGLILICFVGIIIFSIATFIMKRITYYKIAKTFHYNIIKTICVLISPIFFFFFILWKKIKNRKSKKMGKNNEITT